MTDVLADVKVPSAAEAIQAVAHILRNEWSWQKEMYGDVGSSSDPIIGPHCLVGAVNVAFALQHQVPSDDVVMLDNLVGLHDSTQVYKSADMTKRAKQLLQEVNRERRRVIRTLTTCTRRVAKHHNVELPPPVRATVLEDGINLEVYNDHAAVHYGIVKEAIDCAVAKLVPKAET